MRLFQMFYAVPFIVLTSAWGVDTSVQLQHSRVADETLGCEVSTTTQKAGEAKPFRANLNISGFSNSPAVWDPTTNWWKDIKNEPLFVLGGSSGSDSTKATVSLLLLHKVYNLPQVTNIIVGSSTIGTVKDEAFLGRYELSYYPSSAGKAFERTFQVNGSIACTVEFNQNKKKFEVK